MTTTTVRDIADLMRDLPKPSATLQQVEEWLNRKQELLGRLAVEQHAQQDRETEARRKGIEMGRLLGRVADRRGGHGAMSATATARDVDSLFISVSAAARMLGVKPWSVYQLCESGELASARIGEQIVIRPTDVRLYANRL